MSRRSPQVARGDRWALYCGSWQETTPGAFKADALVTDPPYSERTHSGHRVEGNDGYTRQDLGYDSWDPETTAELLPWVRGWACIMNSHDQLPAIEEAMETAGRYVFAPVPIVSVGSRVRFSGDGPANWTVYMMVSRPKKKEWSKWRSLPGAYIETGRPEPSVISGTKQLQTMRKIIRDYTRPDDTVWDPYAGTGTTLLAAVMEGRRAVGSEVNPKTWACAVKRLKRWDAQPQLPGISLVPEECAL